MVHFQGALKSVELIEFTKKDNKTKGIRAICTIEVKGEIAKLTLFGDEKAAVLGEGSIVDIPDMIFNETFQNWSPNNFEWSLIDNSQMQMNKDGSLTKPTVGKSTAKQTKRKQDQTQALTNTDGLAIKETGGGYTSIQFADIDQAVDFIHKELGFFPELGDCSLLFGKLYFHAPGCARLAEKKKAKSMGPPQWIDPMTYPPFISLDEETKKRFILCNYPVVKEDGGIVTDTNIMNLDDEKETHEIKNGKNAGFNNYTLANAIKKCITGARDRTIKVAYAINIDNDMPAHAKKDEIDLATKKPRHVDIETTEPSEEPSEEPSAEPSAEESSRGESHEESIENKIVDGEIVNHSAPNGGNIPEDEMDRIFEEALAETSDPEE